MTSQIVPPSVFYISILPNIKNVGELNEQIQILEIIIIGIHSYKNMFVYGKGNMHNPKYYTFLRDELIELSRYLRELEELKPKFNL